MSADGHGAADTFAKPKMAFAFVIVAAVGFAVLEMAGVSIANFIRNIFSAYEEHSVGINRAIGFLIFVAAVGLLLAPSKGGGGGH